jgi:hypothetical protein
MAVPDTTPFTSYIGLYLSCHQVKVEMDSECGKVLRGHLTDLEGQLFGVRLNIPDGFLAMQNVRPLLDPKHSQFFFPTNVDAFRPLCKPQSASTTFVFNYTISSAVPALTAFKTMYWLVACIKHKDSEGALPGRIQFEVWDINREIARKLVLLAEDVKEWHWEALTDWRFRWVIKSGIVQGVWEKKPIGKNSEEIDAEEVIQALQLMSSV